MNYSERRFPHLLLCLVHFEASKTRCSTILCCFNHSMIIIPMNRLNCWCSAQTLIAEIICLQLKMIRLLIQNWVEWIKFNADSNMRRKVLIAAGRRMWIYHNDLLSALKLERKVFDQLKQVLHQLNVELKQSETFLRNFWQNQFQSFPFKPARKQAKKTRNFAFIS